MTRVISVPIGDESAGSRRWAWPRVGIVVALALAVVVVAAGSRRAEGQTPQPIVGQYRVIHVKFSDESPTIGATALCRPGDYVLGGGAHVDGETPSVDQRLAIGELRPIGAAHPRDGRHGFTGYASEVTPGTTAEWRFTIYAVCASEPVPGHEIVPGPTVESSGSVQEAEVNCPSGRVALGAGARIVAEVGEPQPLAASLHEVRPEANGSGAYALGREWPGGYSGRWRLKAYAVCADAPQGYEVRHNATTGQLATAPCTGDRHILGAGAVATAQITAAIPVRQPESARAESARNASTSPIEAWATCAATIPAPPPPPPPPTSQPCPPDLPNCQEE